MNRRVEMVAICIVAFAVSVAAHSQTNVTNANNGSATVIPVFTGSSTIGNSVLASSAALPLSISGSSLGTTAGSVSNLLSLTLSDSNWSHLNVFDIRNSNGSDWTTATTRIQLVTDVTPQGYIDFNPVNDSYGLGLGSSTSEFMRISSNGFVGIGTTSPNNLLELSGGALDFYNPGHWVAAGVDYDPTTDAFRLRSNNGGSNLNQTNISIQRVSGNVGVGTTSPGAKLDIVGTSDAAAYITQRIAPSSSSYGAYSQYTNAGSYNFAIGIDGASGAFTFVQDRYPSAAGSEVMRIARGGNVGIGTTSPQYTLDVTGTVHATGLINATTSGVKYPDGNTQTTAWTGVLCGGDYAEAVNAKGSRKTYAPGDVLVIGDGDQGEVEKSAEPYSTMVAGIFATKPGVIGRRQSLLKESEEIPMAMVGIVPTKVTAENGPIHRGDLLVTSSAIGYAMKGTDRSRLVGAVIGKAMGPLESGIGVIEVLVTLQ